MKVYIYIYYNNLYSFLYLCFSFFILESSLLESSDEQTLSSEIEHDLSEVNIYYISFLMYLFLIFLSFFFFLHYIIVI